MRDGAVENLAGALAEAVKRLTPDMEARLIASLFMAAWQTVLTESIRLSPQGAKTRRTIQQLLGRALRAVSVAAEGTPYGERS
jgi:hypothetical protein